MTTPTVHPSTASGPRPHAGNGRSAHDSRLYGTLAHRYDALVGRFFLPRIAQVIRALDLPPGGRVLEVGVGTGSSLAAYPARYDVVGVDRSPEMLAEAREKAQRLGLDHVSLVEGDATALPFPDDDFDVVLAFHVVSVVDHPRRLMAEVVRVCRPGGTVVVVNRFRSDAPALGGLERRLEGLTRHLGWHTLDRDALFRGLPLRLLRRFRGGPCGAFTTVVARNVKRA
jgi:phosphatidylethanolamine/phosphatidyl-N-methylethanolamine N-methyltransferase